MTREEFKKLKVGDMVTHPYLEGILMVSGVAHELDCSTNPAKRYTSAITVDVGRYMKLVDVRDVAMLQAGDAQLSLF